MAVARAQRPRPPLLILLAAIAIVCLAALPLVYLVVRAVGGGSDAWEVLGRERLLELVWQTGLLVGLTTAGAVAIGVVLAWLVVRTDLPGRHVVATLAALPLALPSYVVALALIAAVGPRGLLRDWLAPLGVERLPEIYGLWGAVLALTLSTYPYVYLLTAAAMQDLDPSFEEAARSLGRGNWSIFRVITAPALRTSAGASSLLVALYALSDFGAVSLMQYGSLTRAIYLQYRALFDRTPAAVLGLILVLLTAVVLAIEAYTRGHGRTFRAGPGASRQAAVVALGRWRWPALAFCWLVIAIALLLPLAVLVYWFARAGSPIEALGDAIRPALNSAFVAALAGVAAIACALPVALLAVRYPSRWSAIPERLAYAANALPGIVIALSLVFFAARYAPPIYQTTLLLVLAYVVRFLPQAVGAAHAGLLQVSPHLEEAARGLGKRRSTAFARVTTPLVAPGLLAGATLVFLSTMKELPATLLLRPTGFDTLATEIWGTTAVGSYAKASVPALLLVVVSAPVVYLLVARPRLRGARDTRPPGHE